MIRLGNAENSARIGLSEGNTISQSGRHSQLGPYASEASETVSDSSSLDVQLSSFQLLRSGRESTRGHDNSGPGDISGIIVSIGEQPREHT